MKKKLILIACLALWALPAPAQQKAAQEPESYKRAVFESDISVGYRWVSLDGDARAGEYEYLHSTIAGSLGLEWDPLPHRFVLDTYYLNEKDYYGEIDYSYRDVVVVNLFGRGIYHNLDHHSLGEDDASTTSPSFKDHDPGDKYWVENDASRAFIRLKTPDFPFHVYAEARGVRRRGEIQQRFMPAFTTGAAFDKASRTREIDWNAQEVKAGINSHLGPVELDYTHTVKKFEAGRDDVLYDAYPSGGGSYSHNLVPDTESSSDSVKMHTTYTGRLAAAATYAQDERKNKDGGAEAGTRSAAADITFMPKTYLVFFLKYRFFDIEVDNPDTLTGTRLTGDYPITAVRDSISSNRSVIAGTVRYNPIRRLTLKGEAVFDAVQRDVWHTAENENYWNEPSRTTKRTGRLGAAYYLSNKITLRADYGHTDTDNPAFNSEPNTSDSVKASVVYSPVKWLQALVSYGGVRNKRDELIAPLAGGAREDSRDQVVSSVTVLMGQKSSLTASHALYQNRVDQTLTYLSQTGAELSRLIESGVPYKDVSHTASMTLTHAYDERTTLTAEASRSYSRGRFRNSGEIAGSSDIAELTDIRIIESIYSAGVEIRHNKHVGSSVRYQHREYDDKIDNLQDGVVKVLLATLSVKW